MLIEIFRRDWTDGRFPPDWRVAIDGRTSRICRTREEADRHVAELKRIARDMIAAGITE